MKKINWKTSNQSCDTRANLGSARFHCISLRTFTGKRRWYAIVYFDRNAIGRRIGPFRHSLLKAKEDAMRLGCEMLLDFHESIITEMRSFGLDVS